MGSGDIYVEVNGKWHSFSERIKCTLSVYPILNREEKLKPQIFINQKSEGKEKPNQVKPNISFCLFCNYKITFCISKQNVILTTWGRRFLPRKIGCLNISMIFFFKIVSLAKHTGVF